jgi:hypothetical protein
MAEKKPPPRYVLKVGEIFRKEEGLEQIRNELAGARKVRLSNLPTPLLRELLPLCAGKTAEINAHDGGQIQELKAEAPAIREVKSQWFQDFLGENLHMGEVASPSFVYHVLWSSQDGIRRVQMTCDPSYTEFLYRKNFMMRLEGEQTYARVLDRKEGLDVIREHAKKASIFRACVIPPTLLRSLIEGAMKTDYRIITSRKDPLHRALKNDPEVRIGSGAKIYYVYGGEESNVGSLRLNHELFFIHWREDKIFNVMKFENLIFSNYLARVFDNAWKYSIKV